MLIFEAEYEIEGVRQAAEKLTDHNPSVEMQKTIEALKIAQKALKAQKRLCYILNDFYAEDEETHKNDTYSRALCMDLLKSIAWDYIEADEAEKGQQS